VKGTVVIIHRLGDEPIGRHMTVRAKDPLYPTTIAARSLRHGKREGWGDKNSGEERERGLGRQCRIWLRRTFIHTRRPGAQVGANPAASPANFPASPANSLVPQNGTQETTKFSVPHKP